MLRNGSPIRRSLNFQVLAGLITAVLAVPVAAKAQVIPNFTGPTMHPAFGSGISDMASGDVNHDGRATPKPAELQPRS